MTDSTHRRDLLLAKGGIELQEIFYNIPGAETDDLAEGCVYKAAIAKLDSYFAPQRHEIHERFLFWNLRPENDESLLKFLMRAQTHANKCNFGKSESESNSIAVIDRFMTLAPPPLREKLLQEENLTLQTLIKKVSAYETNKRADRQIASVSSSTTSAGEPIQKIEDRCKGCGYQHRPGQQCPAIGRTCSGCGGQGHFRSVCPRVSKPVAQASYKKKWAQGNSGGYSRNPKRRHLHAIEDEEASEEIETLDRVFSQDDVDDWVCAYVGGILIRMEIDSGVRSNIIDERTWIRMSKEGVQLKGQLRRSDKQFRAYGQEGCLTLVGMFEAEIQILDLGEVLSSEAKFYVVKNGPQPLLGRVTAKTLRVLVTGLPSSRSEKVQSLDVTQPFPKIKGIQIHIPIDKTVQPVAQPLRKVPLAYQSRVGEKLDELERKDVIEKVSGFIFNLIHFSI